MFCVIGKEADRSSSLRMLFDCRALRSTRNLSKKLLKRRRYLKSTVSLERKHDIKMWSRGVVYACRVEGVVRFRISNDDGDCRRPQDDRGSSERLGIGRNSREAPLIGRRNRGESLIGQPSHRTFSPTSMMARISCGSSTRVLRGQPRLRGTLPHRGSSSWGFHYEIPRARG